MTTNTAPPGTAPDLTAEPDERFAGIPTTAMHAELRRRRLTSTSRDKRAPATSATGRWKENPEFLQAARRFMRAAGRRVGAMDIEMLGELHRLLTAESEAALGMACWELRRRGFSWREIGEQLGMRKQSAWMRFAKYRPDDMPKAEPRAEADGQG